MIDICFVGNSSIDFIKTKNEKKRVFGGSCIYSSLSCRTSTNKSILVISNVNRELNELLLSKNINVKGNVLEKINSFDINESNNSCTFINNVNIPILIDEQIDVDHLHVSFRKGVDIDNILNNSKINFKSLSVDVMIHSVEDFIPYLTKYNDLINTLFCNAKEYTKIKNFISSIPNIIVTNEDKPILLIKDGKNYIFDIIPTQSIVSTTGAGDSFIGGYLAKKIENKSIDECIKEGINNSTYSIKFFGPIISVLDYNYDKSSAKSKKIPNNIIVIGNSCAGKSTFISYIKNVYNIYTDIDDLPPLLEMFEIDDISSKGSIDELKKIKSKILYMHDIYEKYLSDFDNIIHYSVRAKDGNGHDIIKPILWDIILEKAVDLEKKQNNIIQFSRGKDELYENEFGCDVYKRSLKTVINKLSNPDETIIINLNSDLEIRKKRNYMRYSNGGHFVSEDTMDKVYGKDIFIYDHIDTDKGFIEIDGIKYPVFTIFNNKFLSDIELNEFMMYNLNEVIKYFDEFRKVDINEYERNSKRYLAKQSKQRI